MQSIFAKTYIHCYLKLTGSDFTFFADENFGGKKLSLSEGKKKKAGKVISPICHSLKNYISGFTSS